MGTVKLRPMQKITPFIWFGDNAEEAVRYYVSVFKNSRIRKVMRTGNPGGGAGGKVIGLSFELEGQEFMALNGAPARSSASGFVSFFLKCRDQKEVDYYWGKLSRGGDRHAQQCGWLKDKYGIIWQIVPEKLDRMLADPDPGKTGRVTQAMLKMKKIDIARLNEAYARE